MVKKQQCHVVQANNSTGVQELIYLLQEEAQTNNWLLN